MPAFTRDEIPGGWEADNMKPISYSDLNGHEAFKMAIKHVEDRWFLYLAQCSSIRAEYLHFE
jgi:hypothetical protein